jgi:8-oxo-dGTP diphosphatase
VNCPRSGGAVACDDKVVEAAGGVLWRAAPTGPGVEIALVHRPKYDDWSIPKGKLRSGEHPLIGALREVEEETGFTGRLGRALGEIQYLKNGRPKRVRYWAMQAASGKFCRKTEVDRLIWLPPADALGWLRRERDPSILEAFVADLRPTSPSVIVRHASAGDRATWAGADRARPLDELGRRQAAGLVDILRAFGARRILSADVLRCVDTVRPFAIDAGLPIVCEPLFSEPGFAAAPAAAVDRLLDVLSREEPTVVCSQGGTIPSLLQQVCDRLGGLPWDGPVAKGGFVVLHRLASDVSRLVAVEEFPPVSAADRCAASNG